MPSESADRIGLARILSPRSVAVIGASDDLGKFGGRVLHYLIKHGYDGRIVPVNPKRAAVMGLPAVRSILEAGKIDVATVAVPPEQVVETIDACARAGVGAAVVITSRMAEIGGEGRTREREAVRIARAQGMRIIGPNCLGFVNLQERLALTASVSMGVAALPVGSVAIVSQSGALMATMFNYGHDTGVGFSKLVSVGNQADVTENDVFEYLIEDPHTRAVCFYLEGLSDARRFFALAARARQAGKAVVAVKTGRSAAGSAMAFSHTASLAGPYRLFAAAARAHGVVLADDPEAAVAIADALARWPAGLPEGAGIAAVSGSGGGVGILADRLADAGFALARAPVDAGALGQGFDVGAIGATLTEIARDPRASAVVFHMTTQPFMAAIAQHLVALEREAKKPVLLVLAAGSIADDVRTALREARFGFHNRLDDALRVLRGLADQAVKLPPAEIFIPTAVTVSPETDGPIDAMELVAQAGIRVARAELAKTAEAAAAAAARVGYPIVLKVWVAGLSHKSDAGGVVTNIPDAAALAAAHAALASRFGGRLDGVLVQQQADGVAELLLGSLWDDAYGPFVVVGAGGIYAEIFADSRVAPAPLTAETARRLIDSLRVAPILQGARGRPAADLDAATRDLAALSRLAAALGPRLLELDINPLILGRAGTGSVAVDVRIKLAATGSEP